MEKQEAVNQGLELVNSSTIAMLGTNGEDGFPHIKAMLKMVNQGLKKIWFSTNTSSKRVEQIKKNPKVCVYFVDPNEFKGLMLVGNIKILQDKSSRQRLWREGFERYYPLGVDDPDYSVLCFTGLWGNFYHSLSNIDFEI